jgi:hypothetical protein
MPKNKDNKKTTRGNTIHENSYIHQYYSDTQSTVRYGHTLSGVLISATEAGLSVSTNTTSINVGITTSQFQVIGLLNQARIANSAIYANISSTTFGVNKVFSTYHLASEFNNIYRDVAKVKNSYHKSRLTIENPAPLELIYFDLEKEGFVGSTAERDNAEDGIYKDGNNAKWFDFPDNAVWNQYIPTEHALVTGSKEYRDAAAYIDNLTAWIPEMNAGIPKKGRVWPHVPPLNLTPTDFNEVKNANATVRVTLGRGGRQSFNFASAWLRNFNFGGITNYYTDGIRNIYLSNFSQTIENSYTLIKGESIQHFSAKQNLDKETRRRSGDRAAATYRYEGNLHIEQVTVKPEGELDKYVQGIHGYRPPDLHKSTLAIFSPNVLIVSRAASDYGRINVPHKAKDGEIHLLALDEGSIKLEVDKSYLLFTQESGVSLESNRGFSINSSWIEAVTKKINIRSKELDINTDKAKVVTKSLTFNSRTTTFN